MWTKLLIAGALAAVLSATAAIAQQPGQAEQQAPPAAQPEQQMQPGAETGAQGAEMKDLTGLPIYSSDGKELGKVANVTKGAGGDIEAIQFDMGGFLGLGAKNVEVTSDKYTAGKDRITLSMTADEAQQLPEPQPGQPQQQ